MTIFDYFDADTGLQTVAKSNHNPKLNNHDSNNTAYVMHNFRPQEPVKPSSQILGVALVAWSADKQNKPAS